MKKFVLFSICALAIASCSKDKDLYDGDEVTKSQIQENVRNILGDDFDTSQGYDMLQTGEVTITILCDMLYYTNLHTKWHKDTIEAIKGVCPEYFNGKEPK